MLLLIILSSLFAFLAIVFSLIIYLFSSILDESDDDASAAGLGIDSQDFITTPVASPNDSPTHGTEASSSLQSVSFTEGVDCYCTLRERAEAEADLAPASADSEQLPQLTSVSLSLVANESDRGRNLSASDLEGATAEEIKSAELNSKLLEASARQREVARDTLDGPVSERAAALTTTTGSATAESTPDGSTCDQANEASDNWTGAPAVQKSKLTSVLGANSAKLIIDDLDSKEMQSGGSVLHWCKTRPTLEKLVEIGVPLDLVNKRKETALHVAIRRHKLQVLIGLLIHGADIEKSNELQETPLIVACQVRNIFAVQMLLIFEANFDSLDRFGHSARHHTAVICEHNKTQQNQQSPSAAHLILAMLNEIGAKRCPTRTPRPPAQSVNVDVRAKTSSAPSNSVRVSQVPATAAQLRSNASCPQPNPRTSALGRSQTACPEGCASTGIYNGNSYKRWPNFKRESLYKRHMFEDIIEAHLAQARGRTNRTNTDKVSRLLCIDGGGLRGVIVCQILIEMEKYLKRPMVSYFDWIGGTSVGAFIACSLSIGVPLKQLRQICFDVKDEVFSGGRPYNSKFLERVLKRTLGPERRLSEIKDKKLAVTTVLADREPIQLRMFRNYMSPNRMLEKYGYASDTFNNMSGHSIVSGRRQIGGKKKQVIAAKSVDTNGKALQVSNYGTQFRDKIKPASGVGADENTDQQQQSNKDLIKISLVKEAAANDDQHQRSGVQSGTKDVSVQPLKSKQPETHALANTSMAIKESDNNYDSQEATLEENDPDPIIWKVVRASSAAPFFFKPYGPYLDGGIISNNPTLDMLNEFESYHKVRKFLRNHIDGGHVYYKESSMIPEFEVPRKLNLVVSLGTGRGRVIGRQTMIDFGQVASGIATVFSPLEFLRSLRAARDFFKKLMQQSCHTDDYILDRAQAWCSSLSIPYFRINPPLATIFSIDDKRDEQLINALWQTKLYMRAMKDQLSELGEILDGSR